MVNGLSRSAYVVLGIDQHANDDEIRSAARKLLAKFHPDRCKEPDALAKFKEVQKASDALLSHRSAHDRAVLKKETASVPDSDLDAELARANIRVGSKKKKKRHEPTPEEDIIDGFDPLDMAGGNLDYEQIPPGFGAHDGIF